MMRGPNGGPKGGPNGRTDSSTDHWTLQKGIYVKHFQNFHKLLQKCKEIAIYDCSCQKGQFN